MIELVQIADDQNTDTDIVRLVVKGEAELIPLFTYLISDSEPHRFFLQVATANRNLSRFSPSPFDTISLSQMLALLEDNGYAKDAIVANITYYDAKVEAILNENGKPETPFIRPTTGAVSRPATTKEIKDSLELPQVEGDRFRIGELARSGEAEVPINPDERILNHHILVAGSTGSGKSNLLSNIAHVAAAMGRSIILFDHKPDHQNHHEENDDEKAKIKQAFSLNGKDEDKHAVYYWTLDDGDPNEKAVVLGVRAQDLNPEILAATIFYHASEELQAEIFAHIATNYSALQTERGEDWTIRSLIAYITDKRTGTKGALESFLYGDGGGTIPAGSLNAIKRKIRLPNRIPSFIDPRPNPTQWVTDGKRATSPTYSDDQASMSSVLVKATIEAMLCFSAICYKRLRKFALSLCKSQLAHQTWRSLLMRRPTSSKRTHANCVMRQLKCSASRSERDVRCTLDTLFQFRALATCRRTCVTI